jgi:hypothetical protein
MMYQFSGRLKSIALALMVIGAIGIAVGFFTNNSSKNAAHQIETVKTTEVVSDVQTQEAHQTVAEHAEHEAHAAHAAQQMNNRPWAAFYVPLFFFFMISLGIFVFYATQVAASAGWSVVLFRLMQGLSAAIVPLAIILFIFLVLSAIGMNHLFPWMHAEGDEIIAAKSFWLNIPGWLIRSFIYLSGFILFRHFIIKRSVEQDHAHDYKSHEKGFKLTIFFIAFFMLSESAFSWDWIMSLDPHWFSTLFAWYIFASSIVTAITVIALSVIYLKSKGYLEFVNESHLHDLAKFMFGFSIFWTYLWFSQYMLIWYANMPEETVYFVPRTEGVYQFFYFFMLILNFIFPILVLMDRDWKRKSFIVLIVGLVIIVGHFLDFYIMVMPSAVGEYFGFGISEISSLLFFIGLFTYFGFSALSKRPLLAEGNPYKDESLHHHF